ncbi:MAG: TonB-dependent receptor [Niabella sp.]
MKKLIWFLLFAIPMHLLAQTMPGGLGNGPSQMGSVYGKVVDSATNKPVEVATVQVYQMKRDSATGKINETDVAGALTTARGEFRIEHMPVMGMYKVVVSGIGRTTKTIRFSFIDRSKMKPGADMSSLLGALDKDLGDIKLGMEGKMLEGVTVTAGKPAVQLGIDRKIYNVENNMTAAGGTAADVLKTIPAVSVDIDGNISVRNGSPQIFVDGRATTLTIDQIPADQIETVEVITNPSAKYDASGGTAGILNIVLKKTKRVGYNGNVRAGIDQRGKVNFGGNVNVRQGKFNVFANAFYNQNKRKGWGETTRETTLQGISSNMAQKDNSVNNGRFMFGRLGFDYFVSNRSTITLSGMAMDGKFNNNSLSNILVDTILSGGNLQSKTIRQSLSDFNMKNQGASLGFVHNFPKNGHQLTADANYNNSNNKNQTLISNDKYDISTGPKTGSYSQLQNGNGTNERITAQVDYTNPISDKAKFESGVRLNQLNVNSENIFNNVGASGGLTKIPELSSRYKNRDRVWAGYTTFSSRIGENFGYQIGLRLESSDYTGTVYNSVRDGGSYRDSVSHFNIQYNASLFPSIFLSQKLKNDQELQLNYSRRINRPNFFQLFPFTDYSDSLNLSRGNPNLKPEFTNSFELSYSKNFNRDNNLLFSVYYKTTNDLITRYQNAEINPLNGDSVIVNTYINANSSYVSGFEAVSKNKIADWWDFTANLNIYTSKIKIDDPNIETVDPIWSWFGKINNNFKLPKNFTLQLSGNYNSKRVLGPGGSNSSSGGGFRGPGGGGGGGNAQGYSMPSFNLDAALKYEFLKKKASVTLSVSDLLRTDRTETYTYANYFNQHSTRRRDQQFFRLSFSYNFGKFDASLFKRKNMRSEQDNMQGSMEGMGGGTR